jgi:hypothetical protein
MRRGFATWASANGWDIKGLMSYVGWKDMKSALRYVDAGMSFGGLAARATPSRLEASDQAAPDGVKRGAEPKKREQQQI